MRPTPPALLRRALPKFCGWNQNRANGKWRVRFRRGRFSSYLPAPDAPDFAAAYAAALTGKRQPSGQEIGASKTPAGTLGAIIKAYLDPRGTSPFKRLAAETRRSRTNILENFAAKNGDKPIYRIDLRTGERIMLLKREHMQRIVNEKSATPSAQRNFLAAVRVMFEWAVGEGRLPDNPALGAKRQKLKSAGYKTGTEADIQRIEARHPIGTKERLAFALILYTGQRRSDVVRIGPQHIHKGILTIDQSKTEGGEEAHLEIPVHPKLQAIIEATPTVGMKTFLVTGFGQPYTAPGFGNWFRELCDEAGCHDVSAQSFRKATGRRLAEIGCTVHQIASILGHATLKEVERYTRAADRKRLAREAMAKLVDGGW
jgi:integrase